MTQKGLNSNQINIMKTTLSTTEAAHKLISDENAGWSRAGAFALVEYLEEMESDVGEEIEFCEDSLRWEYSEYADLEDWGNQFWRTQIERNEELDCADQDQDVIEELTRDFIRDRGTLIEFDGGIIVSAF